jgi:hypothetical protein
MGRRSAAAPVTLGDTCAIPFLAHPDTETPTAVTGTPSYEIRSAAGLESGVTVATGSCTAVSGVTGGWFVSHAITAGNGFVAGTVYYVLVSYVISSATYIDEIDLPVA